MKPIERTRILVIGDCSIEETEFRQRNLIFTRITLAQLADPDLTNIACGILLGKHSPISEYFKKWFCSMCELGILTAIFGIEDKTPIGELRYEAYEKANIFQEITDRHERRLKFDSLPWVYMGELDWKIAEVLARYNPGPSRGNPVISLTTPDFNLDPQIESFLKRAFHDAESIYIKKLQGGKTAKETLCVYANRKDASYGPQPMPFFVKWGSPKSIADEIESYTRWVEPFIPFHLRPALNEARCLKTLTTSALVCDFVENALPLRDALRTGQADGVIFSLFETTLRGIRSHTLNGPKISGVIEDFFNPTTGRVRAAEINQERIKSLADYGILRNPITIQQNLLAGAAKMQTRQGIYHGDLHAGNVMVRNRDAIVIDFASMGPFGPLSADQAILEVSLIFGTDDHDDSNSFNNWRTFVDHLFENPLELPLQKGNFPQFTWLHKAVRELRHVSICCGVEKKEALVILIGCLIRFGRHTPSILKTSQLTEMAEKRRIYALVIADRIFEKVASL